MNETSKASNILEQYDDAARITTIGRLYKEGHIDDAEFLNLIVGDRNYFLTESIQKIQETLSKSIQPTYFNGYLSSTSPVTPWTQTQSPIYTSGAGLAQTYSTGSNVIYSTTTTN